MPSDNDNFFHPTICGGANDVDANQEDFDADEKITSSSDPIPIDIVIMKTLTAFT